MKKNIIIIVIIFLLIIEFLLLISPGDIKLVDSDIKTSPSINKNASKLEIKDLIVGEGNAVKSGDTLVLNYIGKLKNGTEFDNSYKRGEPFETTIGIGQVIKGWDEGLVGMKEKGKRALTIPPELGYGANGAPPDIPPNATLYFEVELIQIK